MITRILLLLIFNLSIFPVIAQNLYFPQNFNQFWEKISPSSQNFCKPEIDSLYNYLESNNTKAFILLKDGRIVLEKYFGSFTKDSSWNWQGASSTLTATLFGIAQSNELLSIEKSSQEYLNEGWSGLNQENEASIKVRDHLKMATGLEYKPRGKDCKKSNCFKFQSDVGQEWIYQGENNKILEQILLGACDKSLNQFTFSYLRGDIGMGGSFTKEKTYNSNLRAAARFGLFLLAEGKWNKKELISDNEFFKDMTTSSQALNPAYGFLTWVNGNEGYQIPYESNLFSGELNPYAPSDMYAAIGKGGQLINVVPSEGLVWVRFGNQPELGNGSTPIFFNNNIWKRINKLDCQSFVIEDDAEDLSEISPMSGKNEIRISTKIPIQKLMIADKTGKIYFAEDINSKKLRIDLKQFPKGTYYAKLYFSEEIVSTHKFLVK